MHAIMSGVLAELWPCYRVLRKNDCCTGLLPCTVVPTDIVRNPSQAMESCVIFVKGGRIGCSNSVCSSWLKQRKTDHNASTCAACKPLKNQIE